MLSIAHINIHPTPLISFQIPAAYAIYWAVSELLSIFSSWFSKPVSKKRGKISSSVWAFIECYSSPSECEQGENIFPVITKEQSGWNTLLFLYECGRGVDILNLFRCLILKRP